jgi:hypothetical protein
MHDELMAIDGHSGHRHMAYSKAPRLKNEEIMGG